MSKRHGLPQLDRKALASMTAKQVVEARRAGQLRDLLAGQQKPAAGKPDAEPEPKRRQSVDQGQRGEPPLRQLGRDDLDRMTAAQIVEAHRAGQLRNLTTGR